MRKGIVIVWLFILLGAVLLLFWQSEIIYALPTPVPKTYKPVELGSYINLSQKFRLNKKPLFLHFFNPDCPCSKFNITHFKTIAKQYGTKADFAIVVLSTDKDLGATQIQKKFGLNIPVLFDSSIAVACGVYSTPQAVILSESHKMFYRGNYNRSRYCTDAKSNYAQMALESLLKQEAKPVFSVFALRSYGCELPMCTKQSGEKW